MKLVTIPHTGTHFAQYVLRQMGAEVPNARDWGQHHISDWRYGFGWLTGPGSRVVTTMRDPVMQRISVYNRSEKVPIRLWEVLRDVWRDERVHVFRVDAPEGERLGELARLAEFVDLPVRPVEWVARNSSADVLGLKAEYPPVVPARLCEDVEWFRSNGIGDMCLEMGYDLSWL